MHSIMGTEGPATERHTRRFPMRSDVSNVQLAPLVYGRARRITIMRYERLAPTRAYQSDQLSRPRPLGPHIEHLRQPIPTTTLDRSLHIREALHKVRCVSDLS
jgi:hypothetical protein